MDISVSGISAIRPAGPLDLYKVREIMTSNKITQTEKIKFLKLMHCRWQSGHWLRFMIFRIINIC